jgi:hypothetical protein
MSTYRDRSADADTHAWAWDRLPWYASESLAANESARVRDHLSGCPQCRGEMERCRLIGAAAKSDGEGAWAPSPAHFDQVMAHIDQDEAVHPPVPTTRRGRFEMLAAIRAWLFATPRPVQWALAVQAGLLAIAVALLLSNILPQSPYESLSSPPPATVARPAQLRVVFGEGLTVGELNALLRSVEARVVSGPSPIGVYTIELSLAKGDSAGVAAALAGLRANSNVRLAEPANVDSR